MKQPHPTSKKYKHRDIQTKLKKTVILNSATLIKIPYNKFSLISLMYKYKPHSILLYICIDFCVGFHLISQIVTQTPPLYSW